jgi:hypothetical protein
MVVEPVQLASIVEYETGAQDDTQHDHFNLSDNGPTLPLSLPPVNVNILYDTKLILLTHTEQFGFRTVEDTVDTKLNMKKA